MDEHRGFDHLLFFVVVALMGLGLIMVYSASSITSLTERADALYYFKRQLLWVALGLLGMFWFARVPYRSLQSYALPLLLVALFFLILVLIPGVSREIGGARRWLRIGGQGFQPSEFAKLVFVIYMAWSISAKQDRIKELVRGVLPDLAVMTIFFVLILKGPNLSTAAIVAGTYFLMLFLGNGSLAHLSWMVGAGVVTLVGLIFEKGYRMKRFLAFLDPWSSAKTSGYHIIQSLIAIGAGGVWGLGLGQSRQKFFLLPERHTDFIFAIICEELGLVGGVTVVVLFGILIWRGFYVAVRAPDMFGFLLASGITVVIALQVLINLGVVLSLLPTTGVTLPFVSYGGSSLLFLAVMVGILLNVSRFGSSQHAVVDHQRQPFIRWLNRSWERLSVRARR
ncbi:MAG TPA: putative lipid II flippase FtsW [Candidatus Ozemobacteraceae bacterium]|nr:putative lipid II flippase FtsW [Candidatus Ozemobacteraceae bacterium]